MTLIRDCPTCGSGVGEGAVCAECDGEFDVVYVERDPHQFTPADRKQAKLDGRDSNTAFHHESGKPMVDQVPPDFILAVAKVFTYGAQKYGAFNWQEHADEWTWNQLYASCLRHLLAWQSGEDTDPESGLPHLAHAGCNIAMLVTLIAHEKGTDDRGPLYVDAEPVRKLPFEPFSDVVKNYWDRVREEVLSGAKTTWTQRLQKEDE